MDKKGKLDKIIKLLEEIKANQPMVYYPPVVYPTLWPDPRPYVPPYPYRDWTSPADGTAGDIYQEVYTC
jgi:hypothetical protein